MQGALEETRLLRNRVQLSEQAQKAAQSIEIDYTDVIHALEAKVANLQAQQAKQLVGIVRITRFRAFCR